MKLARIWSGVAVAALVAGTTLVTGPSQAQPALDRTAPTARAAAGWTPVFDDGFKTLSTDRWANVGRTAPIGACGAIRQNAAASDKSVLRVIPEPFAACRLTTTQVFGAGADAGRTYRFSARVKLPTTTGHYAAFWANGDPYNEIDVVESFGRLAKPKKKGCVAGAGQTTNGPVFRGVQSNYYANADHAGRRHCWTGDQMSRFHPLDGKFHVYTAVWKPGTSVTFLVDGAEVASFGKKSARAGALALILTDIDDDDTTPGKQGMEVDWVKAWRKG